MEGPLAHSRILKILFILSKHSGPGEDVSLSRGVRQASEWLTKRNQVGVMPGLLMMKRKDGGSQPPGRKLARKACSLNRGVRKK